MLEATAESLDVYRAGRVKAGHALSDDLLAEARHAREHRQAGGRTAGKPAGLCPGGQPLLM